jgi:hypothetical protein
MGKHFIDPKMSEILSVIQVFPCTKQIALFCQNCSLPFSLRSLDIPALLKSWQKHYNPPMFWRVFGHQRFLASTAVVAHGAAPP